MAECAICEKAAYFENNMSHSHRRSNHIWRVDIKPVKVKTEGGVRKMCIYTSCPRSNFVERA